MPEHLDFFDFLKNGILNRKRYKLNRNGAFLRKLVIEGFWHLIKLLNLKFVHL